MLFFGILMLVRCYIIHDLIKSKIQQQQIIQHSKIIRLSISLASHLCGWKTVFTLRYHIPEKRLKLAIDKSCFGCFCSNNWFRSQVFNKLQFKKNLLTHAVLREKINIRWNNLKQLEKIIAQSLSCKYVECNLCASKKVSFSLLQFISFLWIFSSSALRFSNILMKPQPLFNYICISIFQT